MSKIILTGSTQMFTPNSPRNSQHEVFRFTDVRHLYVPERFLQKLWRPLEGVSLLAPLALTHYDMIHSFNAIPYTNKPWIVTFESILPRTIGLYGNKLSEVIINRLSLKNCCKIIALSSYAKEKFLSLNKEFIHKKSIANKIEIIHPNFPIRVNTPKQYSLKETLEITFIGNDFARKGGIVALRVAEKAKKLCLPIKINLVSGMNYGAQVYTDCVDKSKYTRDLNLLNLENINFHKKLLNDEVINLLSRSHLQIMCTLDDTYGYSVLEGFSVGTPAITTNVCALPEFVNNSNGLVVNLKLNSLKNWLYLDQRNKKDYWSILDTTYDLLSNKVLEFIISIIENPQKIEQLSIGAIEQAKLHDSKIANEIYDSLYREIVNLSSI